MAQQPLTKLAKLTEQFPSIANTRSYFMWRPTPTAKLRYPITHVSVQKADTDLMQFQGKNTSLGSYVSRGDSELRGERAQYLSAHNERGKKIGSTLTWHTEKSAKIYAKDLFQHKDQSKIAYLSLETVYTWHKPSPEGSDIVFDSNIVGVEVNIIIYPKPKDTSWPELVTLSEKIKKEQENAWRYNPKVMPKLAGIHIALKQGLKLHAFLSGGGLRVMSLSNKDGDEKAYGEHPHVEEALNHLDEDFLAGGRSYSETYGPNGIYTHYLTGSPLPTSNIDSWLRRGNTFDAWQENGTIFFELHGYKHQEMPKEIMDKAKKNPNENFIWRDRGFVFVGSFNPNLFEKGKGGYTWHCLNPDGSTRDTFYNIVKSGQGKTLWQAMSAAFRANEVEEIKKK